MDFKNIFLIIIAIANLILGLFSYFRNRKSKINLTWGVSCSTVVFWTIAMVLYRSTDQESSIFWCKILYISATLIPSTLLFFTILFPSEDFSFSKLQKFLIFFPNFIIILLISWPGFIIKDVIWRFGQEKEIIWGPGYPLYALYIIGYFSYLLFNLFKKYQRSSGLLKMQLKYMFVGILCSILFGTIFNLFLPSFGNFRFNWLGQITTIFYIGFITAAITRYHLFEIRVILTEVLVSLIALVLLFQALTAPTFILKILGLGVLSLFGVAGYFLIKSVIREIELRAKLEVLYGELKKLDDAKSEFISIASHQLRTPLTAIKGYVSMMLEKDYGEIPDKMNQPLTNVYASNERLINLVGDILNISKIEAGKMEMEWEKASLEDLILDIMNELKVKADAKKLYLTFVKPTVPIPLISIDKNKMRQVIMNFIDNSIKYTEKGGTTIELRRMNSEVRIKVSDTGMGIDKEYIGRLFQSFSRANVGAKTHPEGTGLGLYIARKYIEMHKGRVWVESPGKGHGSSFFIELPVK